jgi:hypothetical protein
MDWALLRPAPFHPVLPATPPIPKSPPNGEEPPGPSESQPIPPASTVIAPLGLDQLGLIHAIGGLAFGLIALFSSYDHITPFIVASVATVVVDAQLATGSRLRAADDAVRAREAAARAADVAGGRRSRSRSKRERGVSRKKPSS